MDIIAELVVCAQTGEIGAALKPCEEQLGQDMVSAAAESLVMWLAGCAARERSWQLRLDGSARWHHVVRSLVLECPALLQLFEISDDLLDFRPSVNESTRRAMERYARDHYHPVVEH